jgi:hypothetical protein
MSRTYRALLLWLIAIAIPFQGIAAIAMSLCAPALSVVLKSGTPDRAEVEAMHRRSATSDPKTSSQMSEHGHWQGQAHSAVDPDASKTAVPDLEQSGHAGHSMLKCCSAACSLVAYMPPSLTKHSRVPSPAPSQAEATFYPDVFLDGLERPPRNFLA